MRERPRRPDARRWGLVAAVGLLAAIVAGVLVTSWLMEPGDEPHHRPAPGSDPISGDPMFNRGGAAGGGWEVVVWTGGPNLWPAFTLVVVINLVPPPGEPPAGAIRLVAVGANGRTFEADFDPAERAVRHTDPAGRTVYQVRLENPLPGFPSQAGFGRADLLVKVQAGPGGALRYEGTLALEVISRRH